MKRHITDLIKEVAELDSIQLDTLIQAVKYRRNQLHCVNAQSLRVGDRVAFGGRSGMTEKGTVKKIKIKYVLVETDRGSRWNVPGSHLTQLEKETA